MRRRLLRLLQWIASRRLAGAAALALVLTLPGSGGAQTVFLSLGAIETGVLRIDDVRLDIPDLRGGPATLNLAKIAFAGRDWRDVKVRCASLDLTHEGIACAKGEIALPVAAKNPQTIPLSFSWRRADGALEAAIEPAAGEVWCVTTGKSHGASTARLLLQHADIARVAPLVPSLAGWQLGGRVSGEAVFEQGARDTELRANLALEEARFGNAAGTVAGEKIVATVRVDAQRERSGWTWHGNLDWSKGEAYAAPFYLASPGVVLETRGSLDGAKLAVESLSVEGASLGRVDGHAAVDLDTRQVVSARFASGTLDLAKFAPSFIAPMLDSIAGPKLEWSGQATLSAEVQNNALVAAELSLKDVALREAGGRYAIEHLAATIPWRDDATTEAQIDLARMTWGKLPIGPISLPLKLRGQAVRLLQAKIPLLDGEIVLDDVRYTHGTARTSWRAAIAVTPVSMERLTEALGWPRMSGIFSASIPGIHQDGSTIAMDGALVVQVFDGFASVTDLRLIEPFGRVPRLFADVELRNFDLEMLTRTFSFGSITGRIDGDLKGLEVADTRPLRFDARIESSPGDYRKRISQRAVQNISALGGAGAAAAIQRSVLRVFEEFGYGKLGMTCRLRDSICEMDGVEPAPNGYVMVKGAGVPAISVIGYNRRVDWDELLARLKRVTEGNMKPVVK